MLNTILNSQINHNINQINRLIYINNKKFSKQTSQKTHIEKYKDITIEKQNFFTINNNAVANLESIMTEDVIQADHNLSIEINNKIKKINNVYKINYKNAPATGFGDFIRGCYFLLQFSEEYNVSVDFHIYDSAFKNYLVFFNNKPSINSAIANNIYKYININIDFANRNGIIDYSINNKNDLEFISYLNNSVLYSDEIFINTVNFPTHNISKNHSNFIKYMLEPIDSIKLEIHNLLNLLNLRYKNYITYHIRLGDKYLQNQKTNIKMNLIDKIFKNIIINDKNVYLIVSDSVLIKNLIKNKYPTVRHLNNQFNHSTHNNINDIKNTLIDFYLMSFSKAIISYSIYPHGSGFSKWCAITYEIPYICYSLF